MDYVTRYRSPLGTALLASDAESLIGLWFEGQRYECATLAADAADGGGLPVLRMAQNWLDAYFAGDRPDPAAVPLAPRGNAFRQEVWRLLCEIPYGQTVSYGALALTLGRASAARAVGGAVGHNPISIFIPCHRVLGAGGSLTGYAGGVERKRALLTLERARISP